MKVVTVGFMVSFLHPADFDKCVMSCNHHYCPT